MNAKDSHKSLSEVQLAQVQTAGTHCALRMQAQIDRYSRAVMQVGTYATLNLDQVQQAPVDGTETIRKSTLTLGVQLAHMIEPDATEDNEFKSSLIH